MRTELAFPRVRRRVMLVAATLAGSLALVPGPVSAEGLFDFFFGGAQKQQARQAPPQANFFSDPFGLNQQPQQAPAPRVAGSGPAFCVRSCDGKYFPLTLRGNATPVATVPGVLSGERHKGLLRRQYRRRDREQWRALCR